MNTDEYGNGDAPFLESAQPFSDWAGIDLARTVKLL